MLETLKASGDALKQIGATGQGLRAVEDIVSEVESNLQHAAEITSVLSAGSVTGMVNSMCAHGVVIDEEELMRELDSMSSGEEEGVYDKGGVDAGRQQDAGFLPSSAPRPVPVSGASTIASLIMSPAESQPAGGDSSANLVPA